MVPTETEARWHPTKVGRKIDVDGTMRVMQVSSGKSATCCRSVLTITTVVEVRVKITFGSLYAGSRFRMSAARRCYFQIPSRIA